MASLVAKNENESTSSWALTEEVPGEELERDSTLSRQMEQVNRVRHLVLGNLAIIKYNIVTAPYSQSTSPVSRIIKTRAEPVPVCLFPLPEPVAVCIYPFNG